MEQLRAEEAADRQRKLDQAKFELERKAQEIEAANKAEELRQENIRREK